MSDQRPDSDEDGTQIRQKPNQDKTLIRKPDEGKVIPADSAAPTILRQDAPDPDAATIREPKIDAGSATILRQPKPDQATILRAGEDQESATIIRGPEDVDDIATIISHDGRGSDTTYIASTGELIEPKGNTEAGRLLKNRFVLEEKIGGGGMGDVYKALDLRLQEAKERNPYIAIKILNESFSRHKEAFISLQRETTRTRAIKHPNIMAVYDFDKEGDTVFMTMEKLDGKPLDDYLKEHPEGVSIEDAWTIIDNICQGLGRAHDAGVIHSDFKPSNIFWCDDKTAKVFDFGIARAVPTGGVDADGEKTVFDAASLGALTPTYASYEMLKGMQPTKSDDIYAVALVAYELFTGKHPYNRVPADQALEKGMVPEPIAFLKNRHWRALKKGLAFKGEDRTQSIEEFRDSLFSEDPPILRNTAIVSVVLAAIGFGIFQLMYGGAVATPQEVTDLHGAFTANDDIINERLLSENFESTEWHGQIDRSLNLMRISAIELQQDWIEFLTEEEIDSPERACSEFPDQFRCRIESREKEILATYLAKISAIRGAQVSVVDTTSKAQVGQAFDALKEATRYMDIVRQKYTFNAEGINTEEKLLSNLFVVREFQLQTIEQKEITDAQEAAAAAQAEQDRLAVEAAELARNNTYVAYLKDFKDLLKCKGDILGGAQDLSPLKAALDGLRNSYPARWVIDKPGVVAALAGCIGDRIAISKPDRAKQVKSIVQTYLPGERLLAEIEIVDLDPCAEKKLIAQGIRNRSWCTDKLSAGGTGPQMVVIPGIAGIETFATSRMEIRIGDFNQYCESTGCATLGGSASLPVTNISIDQVRQYLHWLSEESGRTYRLPTIEEWQHAAKTEVVEAVDENVNCTVDARGVRLGERLLNTLSGRPNSWGLYNHVGNAREWATAGDEIVALGGAHTDPRSEWTLFKSVAHSGEADSVTGFRIVRQI